MSHERSMTCHFRPALESDAAFLYDLYSATMRTYIELTWDWDEGWQRAEFERRFSRCEVSIVEVDGRAAGSLWCTPFPDSIYVNNLEVLPELQRRGIGTAVLRQVIAQANGRGLAVALSVLEVNVEAKRLYDRLGFAVTAQESPFIRMRRASDAP